VESEHKESKTRENHAAVQRCGNRAMFRRGHCSVAIDHRLDLGLKRSRNVRRRHQKIKPGLEVLLVQLIGASARFNLIGRRPTRSVRYPWRRGGGTHNCLRLNAMGSEGFKRDDVGIRGVET
jgi:hypothetical protein